MKEIILGMQGHELKLKFSIIVYFGILQFYGSI